MASVASLMASLAEIQYQASSIEIRQPALQNRNTRLTIWLTNIVMIRVAKQTATAKVMQPVRQGLSQRLNGLLSKA